VVLDTHETEAGACLVNKFEGRLGIRCGGGSGQGVCAMGGKKVVTDDEID
jgi:hypothetical protein